MKKISIHVLMVLGLWFISLSGVAQVFNQPVPFDYRFQPFPGGEYRYHLPVIGIGIMPGVYGVKTQRLPFPIIPGYLHASDAGMVQYIQQRMGIPESLKHQYYTIDITKLYTGGYINNSDNRSDLSSDFFMTVFFNLISTRGFWRIGEERSFVSSYNFSFDFDIKMKSLDSIDNFIDLKALLSRIIFTAHYQFE